MTQGQRFGTYLRQLRLVTGLTQESLAERTGISSKAISDLERNPARMPRLDTVNLLAAVLARKPEPHRQCTAAARPLPFVAQPPAQAADTPDWA